MLKEDINTVGLGLLKKDSDFIEISGTSGGAFKSGENGVAHIFATGDKKVEFVSFPDKTLAYVPSALGYSAYYPVNEVRVQKPIKAVLMDLDGTSVKSEEFWMSLIEYTIAIALKNPHFQLENEDIPFVAGHSVSEHLSYCINKYCPNENLDDLRKIYDSKVSFELREIMQGRGIKNAFKPTQGLKDFLLMLKSKKIKIGLVTSGLY